MPIETAEDLANFFDPDDDAVLAVYIDRFGVRHEDLAVILLEPVEDRSLGVAGVNVTGFQLLAQRADFPDPKRGEQIEVGVRGVRLDFTIDGNPTSDDDTGDVWRINLKRERAPEG